MHVELIQLLWSYLISNILYIYIFDFLFKKPDRIIFKILLILSKYLYIPYKLILPYILINHSLPSILIKIPILFLYLIDIDNPLILVPL